jgi:hypothetical protein
MAAQISVRNIMGIPIFNDKVATGDRNIDLGAIPAGLYFVEINEGSQTETKKLLIEK